MRLSGVSVFKSYKSYRQIFIYMYTMSTLKNNFNLKYLNTTHQFHLVDPSPWPLMASLGGFFFNQWPCILYA